MQVNSVGIQVRYVAAESTRKWLLEHQVLNTELEFIRSKEFLIFPLLLSLDDATELISSYPSKYELLLDEFIFEKKEISPKNLYEAVSNQIPSALLEFIPKSYDVVGDIIVVDIPQEIIKFKDEIGKALLSLFPSIKTVYRKTSAVSGQFRIRELELLAGEVKCETVHHEHSVKIFVDVCKTYFSPRLGNEHNRIANLVKDEEIIIDLFTGVGSFPLHIAKNKEAKVYAIDLNKTAIENLEKSIRMNRLKGEIIVIYSDCRDAINSLPQADRIIMNLPSKSLDYIDVACQIIKPMGTLYFYHFIPDEKPQETMLQLLEDKLKEVNWNIKEIIGFQKVRESAPHEIQACLEVMIIPYST